MEVDHIISGLGYSFGRLQTFLHDILIKETLSSEAERLRVDCVCQLNEITAILNSPDVQIHVTEHHPRLLNIGLSKSSGSLDEIDNDTEVYDNGIPRSNSSPDMRQDSPGNMRPSKNDSQSKMESDKNRERKSPEQKTSEPKPEKENHSKAVSLTSLEEDEDLYISIDGEFEDEYEDDGFATDEFESGSSEENEPSSPVTSPSADKKPSKKKRRIFKWLKKNKKKEKGSQQGSIAIAGYIHRIEPSGSSKRWCVVQEGKLLCYRAIKDDNPEVTFPLQDCEIRSAEDDTKKQFSFHIIKESYILLTLMAKNNKDMERWTSTIKAGCKSSSPTVESSGIYSQEDGDNYITPSAPTGITRSESGSNSAVSSEQGSPTEGNVTFLSGKNDNNLEENYLEPLPMKPRERVPSVTSPGYNEPLPEIPLEEYSKVVTPNGTFSGLDMTEAEYLMSQAFEESIYEEVPAFNGNADKVTQYYKEKSEEEEIKNGDKNKGMQPLGLEKGKLKDKSLSASSFSDMNCKADQCRLNKQAQGSKHGCWMPQYNEKSQYFQVDLGDVKPVVAVATQGRPSYPVSGGMYVKSYTVAYSKNAEQWSTYKEFGITKVLNGNSDGDTVVLNTFKSALNARYVRIKPNSWHNHIALRVELYTGEIEKPKPKKIMKALKRSLSNGKEFERKEEVKENAPVEEEPAPEEIFEEIIEVNPVVEAEPVATEPEAEKPPPTPMKLDVDTTDVVRRRKKELLSPEDRERHRLNRQSRELLRKLEVVTRVKKDIESEEEDEHEHDLSKSRECLNTREIVRERLKEIKDARDKEKEETKGIPDRKQSFRKTEEEATERRVRLPVQEFDHYDDSMFFLPVQTDPERERELLEETEKAFLEYAKHKKETPPRKLPLERKTSWEPKPAVEDTQHIKEKKAEVLYEEESPRQSRLVKKSHEIKEEKAQLLSMIEKLKRHVSEAKDKKIFFSLGSSNSGAAMRAEAEYHEAQLELAKAKQRLAVIENELKNLVLFDLMNQKSPDISRPTSPEPLEGKRGISPEKRVVAESPDVNPEEFNKGGTHAQKGSVMSLLKAFEQLSDKK